MAEVQHSSPSGAGLEAPDKSAAHGICNDHELSFCHKTEASLQPVKLHPSNQPNPGSPSSFQPETPEHLQGNQELQHTLSTSYSGLSYSGRSSGNDDARQAADGPEAMIGQEAAPAHANCDRSPDACQPGVSPFSLAPFPLSRAGSESLPASPRLEQPTQHKGRVGDLAAKPPSRLRHQAGPTHSSGVASRSASGLVKSYPGLEHTSPVQSMLKKSLSRSLSSWLQSSLSVQHAGHSKSQQCRQQSAELMSMSQALSAQLYPGLERAVSDWAQQAQRDKPHAQPSSNPASRAGSGLYSGLERAISNWAQQAQHDTSDFKPSSMPASRATSGLYPGLERAISNWSQQAQHDRSCIQPGSGPASRATSGLYSGLERAISDWAQQSQQAQHDRSYTPPSSNPASRAASGLYPGLERAISNWAQQAQQHMPQPESVARAMSGMSDLPGLEQAITSWAQQAQHEALSEESSPEKKQASSPVIAMSGLLEGLYPGLEQALSTWAQQGSVDLDDASDCCAPAALSGVSDMPGLESDMLCPAQQTEQLQEALPRAASAMSECLYPGLEQAILACAQQAKHDSPDKGPSAASTPNRTMSELSEAWCPGLERAISNWAQQAQHDIIRSLQSVSPAQKSTPGVTESLIPGLERVMTDWAQQAHYDIISRLQSNASDCMYCPGLEPNEDPPSPEQQPADTHSSSSRDAALAQATGEAILAAARMDNPAAAAKVVTAAVTAAVTGAAQAEAVSEAARAAVTEAVPQAVRPSTAVDEASRPGAPSSPKLLSTAGSASPIVLSRAGSASPKVADMRQMPRAAQANKMLKVHSRDLGQHQQNKHAKLHQKAGPGQSLKAFVEPVAAENAGTNSAIHVSMSPLSLQGGGKGAGVQSPGSPGKAADRMAQALRHRELEQMPHMVSASGASVGGSGEHHSS